MENGMKSMFICVQKFFSKSTYSFFLMYILGKRPKHRSSGFSVMTFPRQGVSKTYKESGMSEDCRHHGRFQGNKGERRRERKGCLTPVMNVGHLAAIRRHLDPKHSLSVPSVIQRETLEPKRLPPLIFKTNRIYLHHES